MTITPATTLLDEAVRIATHLGFSVCREYFDGVGGTEPVRCANDSWITLDRQQPDDENVWRVVRFLSQNADQLPPMSPELRQLFPPARRQAA